MLKRFSWIRIEIALLVGALVLAGCIYIEETPATPLASGFQPQVMVRSGEGELRRAGDADIEVRRVLYGQVDAWNRGDIPGFMEGYWKSPNLRFSSGGEVATGWQETLERYRARYPDREAMGVLSFTEIEVTTLSPTAAVVQGRWALARSRDRPNGLFTLVFRKLDGEWVIVSDHTSAASS